MTLFWLGFGLGAAVASTVIFVGLCVLLTRELK